MMLVNWSSLVLPDHNPNSTTQQSILHEGSVAELEPTSPLEDSTADIEQPAVSTTTVKHPVVTKDGAIEDLEKDTAVGPGAVKSKAKEGYYDEDAANSVYGEEGVDEQTAEAEGEKVQADGTNVETEEEKNRELGDEEDVKSDGHDDKDEDEGEDDLLEQFRPVLAQLDLDKLQQAALMVRLHMLQTQSGQQSALDRLLEMSCKLSPEPMFGAYPLVYRITFSDGTTWAARVPGHGTSSRFNDLDAKKMNCEYWTIRHIKANTSIPVPEIYHWDTTHRVGAPFALMAWVKGVSLYEVWEKGLPDQQRLDILSSIAGYMSQFHKLSYDRLGMLNFDAEGNIEKVGGEISLKSRGFVPWHETKEYEPQRTLMDALHAMSDEMENETMHISYRSFLRLLRMAVESVPDYLGKEQRFALSVPDLNFQNIMCDPDSNNEITGFIDWDGVHAEASSAGYACYPSWITRDWDPVVYDYHPDSESQADDEYGQEDSPATLSKYRQHYASDFAKLAADFDGYDPRMTRLSHMIDAVCIAVASGFCRPLIAEKLLEHAFGGTIPFEISDYAEDFEAGNTAAKDAMVKKAFATMWHAEWEEPIKTQDESKEMSNSSSSVSLPKKSLDSTLQQAERYPQMLNLQDHPHSGLANKEGLQAFGRSMPAENVESGELSEDETPRDANEMYHEQLRQMLTQRNNTILTSEKPPQSDPQEEQSMRDEVLQATYGG